MINSTEDMKKQILFLIDEMKFMDDDWDTPNLTMYVGILQEMYEYIENKDRDKEDTSGYFEAMQDAARHREWLSKNLPK